MPKNQELLNALQNPLLLTTAGQKEALDALVRAGKDRERLIEAIRANKVFWLKFNGWIDADFNADDFLNEGHGQLTPRNLFRQAVYYRVLLGVSQPTIDETVLNDLIITDDPVAFRTLLASAPTNAATGNLHAAPDWNVANRGVFHDNGIAGIQLAAIKALLLKKIKACSRADIDNIDALLTAIDDASFRDAARDLGVANADILAKLTIAHRPGVAAEAATKSFVMQGAAVYAQHYDINGAPKLDPYVELVKADNHFNNGLPAPYHALLDTPEQIATVRAKLGEEYLKSLLEQKSAAELMVIAKATETATLRGLLKRPGQPDAFVDLAVTDQNKDEFRNLAARYALDKQLAVSLDPDALRAVSQRVRMLPSLMEVLKANPSLGFAGDVNKELRAAFKPEYEQQHQTLKLVLPTATIRLAGVTGTAEKWANVLNAPDDQLNAVYNEAFPYELNNLLPEFFLKAANRLMVRQQAVLAVTKEKLVTMADPALTDLADAGDTDALRQQIAVMLGNASADPLFNGHIDIANNPYYVQLRAQAKLERFVRETAQIDLDVNYDEAVQRINTLHREAGINTLPEPELRAAENRAIAHLVAHLPAARIAPLLKLTTAKTEAQLKQALSEMGINQHAWVTKQSMETLQKMASQRALRLKIDEASPIGSAARPELMRLLDSFSLAKQQAVLADPLLIPAILKASTTASLKTILNVASRDISKDLKDEYERIIQCRRINNAEIANIMAGLPSIISLNANQVSQLNALLRDPNQAKFTTEGEYATTIGLLRDAVIAPDHHAVFNEHFGLNEAGNAYGPNGDNMRAAIGEQNAFNVHLFAAIIANPGKPGREKDILRVTARFNKGDEFPQAQIDPLIEAFRTATSKADLITKIDALPLHPTTKKSFAEELTTEQFKKIQRPFTRASLLDPLQFQQTINDNVTRLNTQADRLKKLTDAGASSYKELNRLASLTAMDWLNPAFQGLAMKRANKMLPEYHTLATGCDVIVTQLTHQENVVREQLESLPKDDELTVLPNRNQRNAIIAHRRLLDEKYSLISKELHLYSRLQRILNGDPDSETPLLKNGILQTLEEAKNTKQEVRFLGFASIFKDYPRSQKSAHSAPGYTGEAAIEVDDTVSRNAGCGKRYEAAPEHLKVEDGFFREYTIGIGEEAGHFIEERGVDDNRAKQTPRGIEYEPSVKLTMNKFPKPMATDPHNPGRRVPASAEVTHNARVVYAMGVASQLLSSSGRPPSAKDPIVLQGTDGEKLKYIWTALMVLGSNNPDMKFDSKAIVVISTAFDPAKRVGRFYGFHDTFGPQDQFNFSDHPAVKNIILGVKELSEDKFANRKEALQATSSARAASRLFKGELKDTISEFENANSTAAPEATPTVKVR